MDRQKNPKSRKPIRIKQPKTLESKTCPTFPEMGGGRSWRISSKLIYLFGSCAKGFNKEPAHTVSFIVFCNGVESGFKSRAYEPCSLTRNSHGTGQGHKPWWPQWQFQFQWPARSDSDPLQVHCTSTFQLSSHRLQVFLNRAAVLHHCWSAASRLPASEY